MSAYPPEPKIKLGTLYQKRSAKGTDYMLGTFGSFKLLILPSNETPPGGDPQWNIFASERLPKPDGQQAQSKPLLSYPPPNAQQQGRQLAYQQMPQGQTGQQTGYQNDDNLPF